MNTLNTYTTKDILMFCDLDILLAKIRNLNTFMRNCVDTLPHKTAQCKAGVGIEYTISNMFILPTPSYGYMLVQGSYLGCEYLVRKALACATKESLTSSIQNNDIIKKSGTTNSRFIDAALQCACRQNNTKIVSLLLTNGATDYNGGLFAACKGGHYALVHKMILLGALDTNGNGIKLACKYGYLNIVIRLWPINFWVSRDEMLGIACQNKQYDIVNYLIFTCSTARCSACNKTVEEHIEQYAEYCSKKMESNFTK
jgi:hypothetical protein